MKFNSQKEIFQHLINGGAVINQHTGDIVHFIDGTLNIDCGYNFSSPGIWESIDMPLKLEFESEWIQDKSTSLVMPAVDSGNINKLQMLVGKKTKVTIEEVK